MSEQIHKHTLTIDHNRKITINGVVAVNSLCEKEAELALSDCRLVIKGSGIAASKLSVEDGTISIDCQTITSLSYQAVKGKFSLGKVFR